LNVRGNATSYLVALVLIVTLIGAAVAARWIQRRRSETEQGGRTALRTLCTAEAEFRAKDRDGNGVRDFWTGDVAGLYKFGLIPRELAEADSAPVLPLVSQPIPWKGYFFRALTADDSETPPAPYQEDTDGKSGKVHSLSRFGFVAYPAEGITAPKLMWVINENNTSFGHRAGIPPPQNWPPDSILKTWSKIW
jgi:hypothetical protein